MERNNKPESQKLYAAAGSLTLGLLLGLGLYLIDRCSDIKWVDGLVCFVEISIGTFVFTFVLEGIKKEIQKPSRT